MFKNLGKTAMVTGGSRGIGLNIAEKLSQSGYRCVLVARDEEALSRNIKRLNNLNNLNHEYLKVDLRGDLSRLEKAIDPFYNKDTGDKIDVLINCAGMTQKKTLPLMSIDQIVSLCHVNLVSAMVLTKIVSRKLISLKSPGHIINISSIMARDEYDSVKGTAIYSATKALLIKFTSKMAIELQDRDIRSNVILPSLVRDTDIGQSVNLELFHDHPIPQVTKELVAQLVLNTLQSDLNGEIITV